MPPSTSLPRIAVVGAGVSGLACARVLADRGLAVRVYDKARGPGGRTSTRRSDAGPFDHGAQYFTARSSTFRRRVEAWRRDGHVAEWPGRIVSLGADGMREAGGDAMRFVATPRMSALCRHLASGLDLRCGVRVARVEPGDDAWRLVDAEGAPLDAADAVLVAVPPAQAAPLLAASPALAAQAGEVGVAPCHAAMLAFGEPLKTGFDGAFVEGSPLAWVARDTSKPGREPGERWVLHSTPEWSQAHLEDPAETVVDALLDAFGEALGRALPSPTHRAGHRWLYARVTRPAGTDALYDGATGLGACGDWCGGDRVESAWLSGVALAERVLAALDAPGRPAS